MDCSINYFNGHVVRSSCEGYNDATLTAYYLFDTNGTFLDYSMKFFHDVRSDTQPVTFDRLCQAMANLFPSRMFSYKTC
jgi:hypothetical protein